jgi:hypothetical protein
MCSARADRALVYRLQSGSPRAEVARETENEK